MNPIAVTKFFPELFTAIIKETPKNLFLLFDTLIAARKSLNAPREIAGLNQISADEFTHAGKKSETILLKWFEIFRDIYIICRLELEKKENTQTKNPIFTTFDRSFEQLTFSPDYWFANDSLLTPDFRNNAKAILLAFERYLYDQNGGKCWGALDWTLNKYTFRMICESFQKKQRDPLRELGAILLTARAIANGELGLYIGLREKEELPLCGISDEKLNAENLLKYYHFDRFTKLSFCRQHEFEIDADKTGTFARFELNWMALAALSDFILDRKNARATRTTCSRLMQEQFTRCIRNLSVNTALGGVDEYKKALDRIIQLLDEKDLTVLRTEKPTLLLASIGLKEKPVPAEYSLLKMGITSAKDFWDKAGELVDELNSLLNRYRYDEVPQYTQKQMFNKEEERFSNDCAFLTNVLRFGYVEELQGRLYGESLQQALKNCLVCGGFEIQYGQIAELFFTDEAVLPEKIGIEFLSDRRYTKLPRKLLFPNNSTADFRTWYLDALNSLALSTFSPAAESNHKRRGGRPRKIDNPERPRNYYDLDFTEVSEFANKLWNIYFTDSRDCLDRWLLSLKTAEEILAKKAPFRFKNHYILSYKEDKNLQQRETLLREKEQLLKIIQDVSKEELIARVAKMNHFTIENAKADMRHWVMMAILVKLMVWTALSRPEIWDSRNTVFSFVLHILCATMEYAKQELCFPFHVGVFSDTFLRLGRTRDMQGNDLDRIVEHRYLDDAERQIIVIFLAHFLKDSNNPKKVLDAIMERPSMRIYFGGDRLRILKRNFNGDME